MYKEKPVKINRGDNPHHFLTVVILLAFAVVISLVIAIVWQKVSDKGADLSRYQTLSSVVSGTQTETDELESSSAAKSSSVPEQSEPEEQKLPVFDGAVPESERVMGDYFDDAVFVGDSITEGIMLYGMMSNTTVFAGTGVNLLTVYSAQTVKQEDGSRIPIMDALDAEQFAKVCHARRQRSARRCRYIYFALQQGDRRSENETAAGAYLYSVDSACNKK